MIYIQIQVQQHIEFFCRPTFFFRQLNNIIETILSNIDSIVKSQKSSIYLK